MVRSRLGRAFVAVLMCVSAGVLTSGAAHAQGTLAISDVIKFSGTLVPGPAPGMYMLQLNTCTVTSDGETTVFACGGSGTVNATTSPPSGTFSIQSSDGQMQGQFVFNPTSTPNFYKLKGSGSEIDAGEGGGSNNVIVKGSSTVNFATPPPIPISGKIKLLESSTAP